MANKRLLSLLVASAMSLTYVTANAAAWEYEMDGSDVIITTPFDEKTAVAAKGADVSVNVEKKEAVDADIEALGRTWKNYISKATADVYKVVFTVSNLGTLINGYDNTDQAYFGIYDMTIAYVLDDAVVGLVSKKATLPDDKTITPLMGKTTTDSINLVLPVSSNNTVDTVWPTPNTVVESGNIVAESYIAVKPGSKITLKPETDPKKRSVLNYAVQSQDIKLTAGIWANTNINVEDIVLGETAPVEPIITVKPDEAKMIIGNTVELTASNDKDVKLTYKYESSNTEVATVDDNGVVKAVGVGEATITVSAEGATPAECAINVRKAKVGDTDISDKKIKFLESKLVNIGNHNQLIYITKGDETRVSDKTIGEILGGEWVEGSTVEGTIAIGIISESPLDAFSFEIK